MTNPIRAFEEKDRKDVSDLLALCGMAGLPEKLGKYAYVAEDESGLHGFVLGYHDPEVDVGLVDLYAVSPHKRNGFTAIYLMQTLLVHFYSKGVTRVLGFVPEQPTKDMSDVSTLLKLYRHFGADVYPSYIFNGDTKILLNNLPERLGYGKRL